MKFIAATIGLHSALGFTTIPASTPNNNANLSHESRDGTGPLYILPELAAYNVATTLASALVGGSLGAATTVSLKNEKLKSELAETKSALAKSESEIAEMKTNMEDTIFHMDREFEGQTVRMKKEFEQQLQQELDDLTKRLKKQYQAQVDRLKNAHELKLDEMKGHLQQEFLLEKLEYVNHYESRKKEELERHLEAQHLAEANTSLEEALIGARKEIQELQHGKHALKWWPF